MEGFEDCAFVGVCYFPVFGLADLVDILACKSEADKPFKLLHIYILGCIDIDI